MTGIQETVERVMQLEAAKWEGRSYRYGSRVRVRRKNEATIDATVIDCGYEGMRAVFDFVDQSGKQWWSFDSQLVEVLVY